jgi:hypothetical protein
MAANMLCCDETSRLFAAEGVHLPLRQNARHARYRRDSDEGSVKLSATLKEAVA